MKLPSGECHRISHMVSQATSHVLSLCWPWIIKLIVSINDIVIYISWDFLTNSIAKLNNDTAPSWPDTCTTAMVAERSNRWLDALAPGRFEWKFRYVIFKWILVIDGWGMSCEISLIWMSLDFTDDQSLLVQVMAWQQATTRANIDPDLLTPYWHLCH